MRGQTITMRSKYGTRCAVRDWLALCGKDEMQLITLVFIFLWFKPHSLCRNDFHELSSGCEPNVNRDCEVSLIVITYAKFELSCDYKRPIHNLLSEGTFKFRASSIAQAWEQWMEEFFRKLTLSDWHITRLRPSIKRGNFRSRGKRCRFLEK